MTMARFFFARPDPRKRRRGFSSCRWQVEPSDPRLTGAVEVTMARLFLAGPVPGTARGPERKTCSQQVFARIRPDPHPSPTLQNESSAILRL